MFRNSMNKYRREILLVIFSSIISVIIIDMLVGALIIRNTKFNVLKPTKRSVSLREFNPLQDVYLTPDDLYLSTTDGLDKKPYRINLNHDAFITSSTNDPKDNKTVDIIFFGGSTTEALFVDEDKRFASLVGALLSEKFNKEIISLNAGVSGNHSMHSLINMIAKGIKYNPKIAVIMHNINDWTLLSRTGNYWTSPSSREIVNDQNKIINQESKSYIFFRAIKNIFIPNTWILIRSLGFSTFFGQLNDSEFDGFREFSFTPKDVESHFKSSLNSFIGICRAWDIIPILMTQIHIFDSNNDFFGEKEKKSISVSQLKLMKYQSEFNDFIRDVSYSQNVFLIDLDKIYSGKSTLTYDWVHLNSDGSKEVAEKISSEIKNNFSKLFE